MMITFRSSVERGATNEAPRIRLNERDFDVLTLVYEYEALTRDSLLAFTNFGSSVRLTDRLSKLARAQLLQRPNLPFWSGSLQSIYCLGPKAPPMLAARLGVEVSQVRRRCRSDIHVSRLEHLLRIADLRVAFEKLRPELECQYVPESQCRHEYSIASLGGAVQRSLRPDAFVTFQHLTAESSFFIEVDCGMVSLNQWGVTTASYNTYRELGLCRAAYGIDSVQVLVVTTGKNGRVHHLGDVASKGSVPFWLTTFEKLERQHGDEPIWQRSGDPGQLVSLEQLL